MDRMPIYRVTSSDTSIPTLFDLRNNLFEGRGSFRLNDAAAARTLRSSTHLVEVSTQSGGVWAADESQMFKPSAAPSRLPSHSDAAKIAAEHVRRLDLLPKVDGPFHISSPKNGSTQMALLRRGGTRENRQLDSQVIYPLRVGDFPVVGGGGDFTVTLGEEGKIIGYSGVWRPLHATHSTFDAKVIDRGRADEYFRALTTANGMKLESYDAYVAYYAAPAFRYQEFLYPVYVYRAKAWFGEHLVPLRQIMIPATEFGPPVASLRPQDRRTKRIKPPQADHKERRQRRNYANAATAAPRGPATRPWEAGTSWIGLSGGLTGSQANAQGFVDEWDAAGWHIDFNWGDANAWESDWNRNAADWVDNVDFAFYTGHANMDGWVLSSPDDGFLNFTEVGAGPENPGKLWGKEDLEWAIIAACGPLQDNLISPGGGDVLDRWDGAFDGMHMLLGYGAITFDNSDEGRKVSQYAKGGSTILDSWFRAAKEIQPSDNGASAPDGPDVWVGAMWAGKGSAIDPVHDHAWDYGSVSDDPRDPDWLAAMWTIC